MTRSPFLATLLMLPVGMCATSDPLTRVVVERPAVAPSLLRCTAEPEPLGPKARQRDLAPYVLDLVEAGQDCRRKLGTVGAIVGAQP